MSYEKLFVRDYWDDTSNGGSTGALILIEVITEDLGGIYDESYIANKMVFNMNEAREVFGKDFMDRTIRLEYAEYSTYERSLNAKG